MTENGTVSLLLGLCKDRDSSSGSTPVFDIFLTNVQFCPYLSETSLADEMSQSRYVSDRDVASIYISGVTKVSHAKILSVTFSEHQ